MTIQAHIFDILSYMKSLSLSRPHLLVTVGIPGSGKSHFAERFAATFQAPYVHYDTIMDVASHSSVTSDAYAGYMLRELFKTGHSIVFDGPSASVAERAALRDLASSAGYACLFIWAQTDETTAKARFIKANRKVGRHITSSEYAALARAFIAPTPKEGTVVVISGKHTYATQAKAVLKNLTAAKQSARAETAYEHAGLTAGKRNIPIT